jgi:hypothetical protein
MSADDDRSLVGNGPERDPFVFDACWRLYKRGETNLLQGGVSTTQISCELGICWKAAIRWLGRCEMQALSSSSMVPSRPISVGGPP